MLYVILSGAVTVIITQFPIQQKKGTLSEISECVSFFAPIYDIPIYDILIKNEINFTQTIEKLNGRRYNYCVSLCVLCANTYVDNIL